MATYFIYGIIAVVALLITRYSVPFILTTVQIPHEAVPTVNLMLNMAIFAISFFGLNFVAGFLPTDTLTMSFLMATPENRVTETPHPAATWTPSPTPLPAATWTSTLVPRSEPTRTPTQTRQPTSTRTPTPTPAPQVFGDIRRGEICRDSCYDYGSTVDFCFWSNFETDAKVTIYSYDTGETFDLGNWDLNNTAQCFSGPMSAPYGRSQLEIIGFDGPDGTISRTYDFCVADC